MDEPVTRGLGGQAPTGVTDLRPTPMRITPSSGPRWFLVSIVILVMVAFGVWSIIGQGDGRVLWAGVVVGVLGLVLLLLRVWIRRTLESGDAGTTARVASGEQLDVAGIPMFISAFSNASVKRNRGWNGGITTSG